MTNKIYRCNVFFSRIGSMQICLRQFSCCMFVVFLCLIGTPLHAALNIEIYGGGATQIPIAIVPFAAEEKLKQNVTTVVASDLHRSGLLD